MNILYLLIIHIKYIKLKTIKLREYKSYTKFRINNMIINK